MNRRTVVSFAAAAGLMFASTARAQQAPRPALPPPQPAMQAPPVQPAPAQPVQPPQAEAAPPLGAGMVRMHFHMFRGKKNARIYTQRSDGAVAFVCGTPCTADVPVGTQMRVTMGDSDDAHVFWVPGDLGPEVDIEVKGPAAGALIGGIVMLSTGGALAISGVVLVAVSDTRVGIVQYGDYRTAGYVCLGLGLGVAVGGLILLVSRSREPRVEGDPHRPGQNYYYGREETLLGDLASAKPRDPTTAIPPPPVAPILDLAF